MLQLKDHMAVVGADFIKKYGEDPDIVHAVRAHHEDVIGYFNFFKKFEPPNFNRRNSYH